MQRPHNWIFAVSLVPWEPRVGSGLKEWGPMTLVPVALPPGSMDGPSVPLWTGQSAV